MRITLVKTPQQAGGAGLLGAMGGAPPGMAGMAGAAGMAGGQPGMFGPGRIGGLGNNRGVQGAVGARGGQGGGGFRGVPVRQFKLKGETNELVTVPLAKADPLPPGHHYAFHIEPRRLAIIVAAFPYKKQVEEFRNKLRLPTIGEVLTERVKGDKNESWDSFQFRGLIVERMTVSPAEPGKEPVWEALPLGEAYKELLINTAREIEKDDPKYDELKKVSGGLMMALPKQFPRNPKNPDPNEKRYPDLFAKLNNITATLEKLSEEKDKSTIIVPNKLIDTGFDEFREGGDQKPQQPGPGGVGPETPPDKPVTPPDGAGKDPWSRIPGTGSQAKITKTPIEHCLIRFIDVTLEDGKTYKYRLKVKMANPNYSPKPAERKDTYPQFAKDKELTSDWFEVPQPVVVPPDSLVYAIDPRTAGKPVVQRFVPAHDDKHEVVVQIHRWVESYFPNPEKRLDERPVGDWVMAERINVRRGEYVRQKKFWAPIPIKNLDAFEFVLDEKSPLEFGDESVLVDFEGGIGTKKEVRYERAGGPPAKEGDPPSTTPIKSEDVATEMLIMTPDGRVYTRNDSKDTADPARKALSDNYFNRIKTIRDKPKPGVVPPGGGGNPFTG